MELDGDVVADEAGVFHGLHGSVAGHQVGNVSGDGLSEGVGGLVVHVGADHDQALDAEGGNVLILAGIGAGGDDLCQKKLE